MRRLERSTPTTTIDNGVYITLILGALLVLIFLLFLFSGLDAPYIDNYIASGGV